jgi:hypothetical protein
MVIRRPFLLLALALSAGTVDSAWAKTGQRQLGETATIPAAAEAAVSHKIVKSEGGVMNGTRIGSLLVVESKETVAEPTSEEEFTHALRGIKKEVVETSQDFTWKKGAYLGKHIVILLMVVVALTTLVHSLLPLCWKKRAEEDRFSSSNPAKHNHISEGGSLAARIPPLPKMHWMDQSTQVMFCGWKNGQQQHGQNAPESVVKNLL